MKADFSGYATKAGLKCSDGRTIMPNAFQHQDKMRVPLVWSHGHTDPENVLGHAILENRDDGVYTYGFFNDTVKAVHAQKLLEHGDIDKLSIWANQLIERGGNVLHGAIREVSLVLAGANPGALIENVTIRHSDGDDETMDDEAIIYTGLVLEHADGEIDDEEEEEENTDESLGHAAGDGEETIQDVYDSLNDKQKDVVHFMIGEALQAAGEATPPTPLAQSETDPEGSNTMKHNVFETQGEVSTQATISHDDMKGIFAAATRGGGGSLKTAVEEYALAHSITNIDQLFPNATQIGDVPEWVKRRTEWVDVLLSAVRKSPFGRIKTLSADLTFDDARAKGYIKGDFKKEEFFAVASRSTTPTTIYKKQALDRDDMVDITDFDVISWLKAEMRIMLDEELARAILLGDGRDPANDEKINEGNIRPIAKDNELYTTVVYVNVDDANSSVTEIIDGIVANRSQYKGTGNPFMFTTEQWIAKFMLLRDGDGRRLYKSLSELADELRVEKIIPVEVMSEYTDTICIIVNPTDYVLGANKGGEVSMFDNFDIDYNKQKYLIETRCCGAMVKIKGAMVVKKVVSTAVLVTPTAPTFNKTTGVLSITDTTGVVYKNGVTVVNASGSPYAAIALGASVTIDATPASAAYYFASSEGDSWTFTRDDT